MDPERHILPSVRTGPSDDLGFMSQLRVRIFVPRPVLDQDWIRRPNSTGDSLSNAQGQRHPWAGWKIVRLKNDAAGKCCCKDWQCDAPVSHDSSWTVSFKCGGYFIDLGAKVLREVIRELAKKIFAQSDV